MSIRMALVLRAALGAALLPGCSSEPVGPTEGTLNLSFTTPNGDDGAVLLTLSGGPVDSVLAVGYSVYTARVDANTMRVIVIGQLGSGVVARIRVADSRQFSSYSATVNQVAARTTYLQRDPATYSLSLTAVP